MAHVTAEVDVTRKILLCGQAEPPGAVCPFSKADIYISVISML